MDGRVTASTSDVPVGVATPRGPLRDGFAPLTIGMFLLVALSAFEQLATTTVMPIAAREVGGATAFAIASAAPLATGVLGTIAAGIWADRRGPRIVIVVSIACFVAGLVLTGIAVDVASLVAGRLVQGLGSGALGVAFYVVIGRLYPPALHPKVFAAFSAAWVVPGLVGPLVAGTITDLLSWRWVFLGALGIVAIGVAALLGAWRRLGSVDVGPAGAVSVARLGMSLLLAAALVALSLTLELPNAAIGAVVAVSSLVVGVLSFRGLVPAGTLRAAPGSPAIVAIACLLFGSVFAAQAFLTLFLIEEHDFATATAGLVLTFGGLSWPLSSWLHSRFATGLPSSAVVTIGGSAVLVAIATAAATTILGLDPWVAAITWTLAGAGCGFTVPRLSSAVLGLAAPSEQGAASSGFAISQLVAPAVGLAIAGMCVATLPPEPAYPVVFLAATAAPVIALAVARRVRPRT